MDYIAMAREQIESQYDAECDIIELQPVTENNIRKNNKEFTVQEKSLAEYRLKIFIQMRKQILKQKKHKK